MLRLGDVFELEASAPTEFLLKFQFRACSLDRRMNALAGRDLAHHRHLFTVLSTEGVESTVQKSAHVMMRWGQFLLHYILTKYTGAFEDHLQWTADRIFFRWDRKLQFDMLEAPIMMVRLTKLASRKDKVE